ncbi:MAG: GDP-mannose 4,6-dehydratase [Promethearchaeota archaeon]
MLILVTGGCGFIGSHLVDLLINKGHSVRILDNLSTGNLANIQHHENTPACEFIEGDIRDKELLRKIMKDVEVIYHYSAQSSVHRSVKDPLLDMDINIRGSLNIAQIAVEKSVDRIIYASTGGAIYGRSQQFPTDEATTTEPESPYGISKFSSEKYFLLFHQIYGIGISCMRYANIYGPRQDPRGEAGVISIFLSQILKNEPLTIYGDGSHTRDYLYVQDAVKAAYAALSSRANGVFNIGTGKETSVNEIASAVLKITQTNNKIIHLPERPGEVERSCLDSTLAKKTFDWEFDTSFEEGIAKTWQWVKKSEI